MRTFFRLAIFSSLCPSLAFAHINHAPAEGFSGGLLHTLSGLDHLAALWCLGALAAFFAFSGKTHSRTSTTPANKNWLWLPGLFAAGVALGISLGICGVSINPEPVIAGSVVFWGGVLVLRRYFSFWVQACACVLFALFHGLAHAPLFAQTQQPLAFFTGLSLSFAVCFCAGFFMTQHLNTAQARLAAGMVSLVGLWGFFGLGSFS
jgi:urease accessory protein